MLILLSHLIHFNFFFVFVVLLLRFFTMIRVRAHSFETDSLSHSRICLKHFTILDRRRHHQKQILTRIHITYRFFLSLLPLSIGKILWWCRWCAVVGLIRLLFFCKCGRVERDRKRERERLEKKNVKFNQCVFGVSTWRFELLLSVAKILLTPHFYIDDCIKKNFVES